MSRTSAVLRDHSAECVVEFLHLLRQDNDMSFGCLFLGFGGSHIEHLMLRRYGYLERPILGLEQQLEQSLGCDGFEPLSNVGHARLRYKGWAPLQNCCVSFEAWTQIWMPMGHVETAA